MPIYLGPDSRALVDGLATFLLSSSEGGARCLWAESLQPFSAQKAESDSLWASADIFTTLLALQKFYAAETGSDSAQHGKSAAIIASDIFKRFAIVIRRLDAEVTAHVNTTQITIFRHGDDPNGHPDENVWRRKVIALHEGRLELIGLPRHVRFALSDGGDEQLVQLGTCCTIAAAAVVVALAKAKKENLHPPEELTIWAGRFCNELVAEHRVKFYRSRNSEKPASDRPAEHSGNTNYVPSIKDSVEHREKISCGLGDEKHGGIRIRVPLRLPSLFDCPVNQKSSWTLLASQPEGDGDFVATLAIVEALCAQMATSNQPARVEWLETVAEAIQWVVEWCCLFDDDGDLPLSTRQAVWANLSKRSAAEEFRIGVLSRLTLSLASIILWLKQISGIDQSGNQRTPDAVCGVAERVHSILYASLVVRVADHMEKTGALPFEAEPDEVQWGAERSYWPGTDRSTIALALFDGLGVFRATLTADATVPQISERLLALGITSLADMPNPQLPVFEFAYRLFAAQVGIVKKPVPHEPTKSLGFIPSNEFLANRVKVVYLWSSAHALRAILSRASLLNAKPDPLNCQLVQSLYGRKMTEKILAAFPRKGWTGIAAAGITYLSIAFIVVHIVADICQIRHPLAGQGTFDTLVVWGRLIAVLLAYYGVCCLVYLAASFVQQTLLTNDDVQKGVKNRKGRAASLFRCHLILFTFVVLLFPLLPTMTSFKAFWDYIGKPYAVLVTLATAYAFFWTVVQSFSNKTTDTDAEKKKAISKFLDWISAALQFMALPLMGVWPHARNYTIGEGNG